MTFWGERKRVHVRDVRSCMSLQPMWMLHTGLDLAHRHVQVTPGLCGCFTLVKHTIYALQDTYIQ